MSEETNSLLDTSNIDDDLNDDERSTFMVRLKYQDLLSIKLRAVIEFYDIYLMFIILVVYILFIFIYRWMVWC